ncbi:MAG: hypothetical protein HY074_04985 [Deltaproteobacteria bacterium]|nr:hypothetical protein [Deltaproteobacteria bacterium]
MKSRAWLLKAKLQLPGVLAVACFASSLGLLAAQAGAQGLTPTCEVLLTTPAAPDPELLQSIRTIEKLGAKGGWFTAVSPFSTDGRPASFYLLQSLPDKADASAQLFLLHVEHGREFLAALLKARVPIVLGTIPIESQVEAAALGHDVAFATDALAAAGINDQGTVILLQPSAGKYVLAHEYRHWRDFEDHDFETKLYADLKPFFEASYLTNEDKNLLVRIIWEMRGHATQRMAALEDAARHLSYLNRAGAVIDGPAKELASNYDFEAGQAISLFKQAYGTALRAIVVKTKAGAPNDIDLLARIFSTYDPSKSGEFGLSAMLK